MIFTTIFTFLRFDLAILYDFEHCKNVKFYIIYHTVYLDYKRSEAISFMITNVYGKVSKPTIFGMDSGKPTSIQVIYKSLFVFT